jgi:integrase
LSSPGGRSSSKAPRPSFDLPDDFEVDRPNPWRREPPSTFRGGATAREAPGFRFHDLRHYFASLLIASGADVKVVQARLRHASAKTTLDTYGHLWPDSDVRARDDDREAAADA